MKDCNGKRSGFVDLALTIRTLPVLVVYSGGFNLFQQVEKTRQQEKMKRDELSERYRGLVEKHRLYVKTIRDFQEECRKNEILCSKLGE